MGFNELHNTSSDTSQENASFNTGYFPQQSIYYDTKAVQILEKLAEERKEEINELKAEKDREITELKAEIKELRDILIKR